MPYIEMLACNPEATLIIIKDGNSTRHTRRGIVDLYEIVKNNRNALQNAEVVDRCIGKAAAALMILGGVSRAETLRISTPALLLLRRAGIEVNFDEEVPIILNRTLSDVCPMEKLCSQSDNPDKIFKLIDQFIKEK